MYRERQATPLVFLLTIGCIVCVVAFGDPRSSASAAGLSGLSGRFYIFADKVIHSLMPSMHLELGSSRARSHFHLLRVIIIIQ